MLNIAKENNLAETAFCVKRGPTAEADATYDIRWFTCEIEMDLCGHATLAAAHVIFNFYEPVGNFQDELATLITNKFYIRRQRS